MKNSVSKTVKLVILILLVVRCSQEDSPIGTADDLSDFAKEFLGMRSGARESLSAANNSTINMSFQGAMQSYRTLSGAGASGETEKDSTIIEPGDWQTCAIITETKNADGSTTVVTDYGDGCEEGWGEYRYLVFGKYISTYRYESFQNGSEFKYEYYNRYVSDNYGGQYYYDVDNDGDTDTTSWLTNGHSTYRGESKYDTATQDFSGFYSSTDTTEYEYDKASYTFKSTSENTYDNRQSVTPSNNYEYRNGDDYYSSVVTKPLVMRYDCYSEGIGMGMTVRPFWMTYVSGRESVRYRQDGKVGEFEIDYGDGECDNIITIIENGKIIKVDLSENIYALAEKGG